MFILQENFQCALLNAIEFRSNIDSKQGIESIYVAGLKEVYEAVKANECVDIKDDSRSYVVFLKGEAVAIVKANKYSWATDISTWYAETYGVDRKELTFSILPTVHLNRSSIKEN